MVARTPERSVRQTQHSPRDTPWKGVVCLILGLLGCQNSAGSELLEVSAIEPRQVHFGIPWSLVGDGFALGSQPLVSLRGTVYRAGYSPRDLEYSVRATTLSQERLRVVLPASVQNIACGEADEASHATFRGDIQVAIAAHAAGAPPVTGTLSGAELELYPASQSRQAELKSAQQGQHVMTFAGFRLAVDVEGGLRVVSAQANGRAAASGLVVGDRIVRAAGVTVLQPSDLGSQPARILRLSVRRGPLQRVVMLDIDGMLPRPPSHLSWAAIPFGALGLLWLLSVVVPRRLLSCLDPVHAMRRSLRRPVAHVKKRRLARRVAVARLVPWLAGAVLLVCEVLGRSVASFEQAAMLLPLMMIGSATLIGALSLARAGRGSDGRWSLARGARAATVRWVCVVPAVIVLIQFIIESGVDFGRAVSTQGAAPWEWRALSGPGQFLLFGLFLLPSQLLSISGNVPWKGQRGRAVTDGGLGDWYLCSTAAVATLIFLGGGQLPVLFDGQSQFSVWLLIAKYAVLVVGLRALRGAGRGISLRGWWVIGTVLALPLSAAGLVSTWLWTDSGANLWLFNWFRDGFGECCAAALCLGAVGLTLHKLRQRGSVLLSGELSPWL